ncbi:MAG: hypothetical protein SO424_01180 [[Pasteurella] aerogenes]|nr:hypothetical protein [[Pasteurella] aerogenes]
MRKSLFLSIILTALFSTSALAANNSNIIFSCTATDGKPIMVKKVGSDYEYTYGQFSFKNPIKQVIANENSEISVGSGFITNVMELKNNGISYRVGFLQGRGTNTIDNPSVDIYKNGQYDDAIECNVKKAIKQNFASTKIRRSGL